VIVLELLQLILLVWRGMLWVGERLLGLAGTPGPRPQARPAEPPPRSSAPGVFRPVSRGEGVRGQRCPYCHDELSGALLACESCRTPFHAECCHELRRCTTLGCGGASELPASERLLEIDLRPRRGRSQAQTRRRSA